MYFIAIPSPVMLDLIVLCLMVFVNGKHPRLLVISSYCYDQALASVIARGLINKSKPSVGYFQNNI